MLAMEARSISLATSLCFCLMFLILISARPAKAALTASCTDFWTMAAILVSSSLNFVWVPCWNLYIEFFALMALRSSPHHFSRSLRVGLHLWRGVSSSANTNLPPHL